MSQHTTTAQLSRTDTGLETDPAQVDMPVQPTSRRIGTRAGILAGVTVGAYGFAVAMSLTTVSSPMPGA